MPQMEKGTRTPAELSDEEKGYPGREEEPTSEALKEDPEPSQCDEAPKPENGTPENDNKPASSPTDCALKIETSGTETARDTRRNCSQDEVDSPASSSRTPLSPQYRHTYSEPPPQSWPHREPPPLPAHHHPDQGHHHPDYGHPHPEHGQLWHQPHDDPRFYPSGDHDQNTNVRLPSIAALLTGPYSPQPMPRMAGYNDRADWPPPQAVLDHYPQPPLPLDNYPPVVATLPLDDSRSRTPQPMPHRKRGRLPKETTDFLKAWLHSHSSHPYPSEIEKKQMCHATGLSMSQVSNWMINGRRRILGPSYLSTSRANAHSSPAVALSSPSVQLSSPSVLLHSPSVMLSSPSMMLRSPPGGPPS
ncbi:hypothetical protein C8R43DRAFT_995747 [Mycena crocata]|nr:hypothetical protein C8R43DRAFT_995747 [Mycena crocata]